jgi:hypothetical protein
VAESRDCYSVIVKFYLESEVRKPMNLRLLLAFYFATGLLCAQTGEKKLAESDGLSGMNHTMAA